MLDTITIDNRAYSVSIETDNYSRCPWEESECHGAVSDWTTRNKRPGERVLCTDGISRRHYDVQASMDLAMRVWGCSSRAKAAEAVAADFDYLREWCNDEWGYVGVIVTDEEGQTDALWGIESNSPDSYFDSVATELANALYHSYSIDNRFNLAMECGV